MLGWHSRLRGKVGKSQSLPTKLGGLPQGRLFIHRELAQHLGRNNLSQRVRLFSGISRHLVQQKLGWKVGRCRGQQGRGPVTSLKQAGQAN